MGQAGQSSGPGIKTTPSHPTIRSAPGWPTESAPRPFDPYIDDPLESSSGMSGSNSSRSLTGDAAHPKLVVPSISIRSEYPSIARGHNRRGKQVITAMVSVQVPSVGDRGRYTARARSIDMSRTGSGEDQLSPQFPPSPRSASSMMEASGLPSSSRSGPVASSDPFAHVVADLKHRVVDYKTAGLDQLGPLRLFDLLCVRKGPQVREFHMYLFREALICVAEEKRTGIRSIFSSSSSIRSNDSSGRGVLKLKGRIYIRHVRKVIDSSVPGELSLTIAMQDSSMESFILTFKERGSHKTWKGNIARLLDETRHAGAEGQVSSKIAKLMGNGAPDPFGSRSATGSKAFSPSSVTSAASAGYGMSGAEFPSAASAYSATSSFSPTSPLPMPRDATPGDLAFTQPLAPIHTPIDLVLILSLPAPTSAASIPLKVRLMRSSIAFVLALLGPRDRIALVACEMGVNGTVRKTPFLNTTRYESRKRLEAFVETLGTGKLDDDEVEVRVASDDKRDVVTAVNVALDVVLQRKAKNPLTGIILISDTSDTIKRAQMDLVTARLDAANTPVHALGYGKSHDPSPLWMLSNHTNGSYTFVKEWYHLRDSLAGVIGGLMSVALTNMKLHLNCQDHDFRVTKVSGTSQAIVSTNGKDVDIELKELRHGEVREILVELELETASGGASDRRYSTDGSEMSSHFPSNTSHQNHGSQAGGSLYRSPSFTVDQGMRALGLDTQSPTEASAPREDVYADALIDEVPVTEIDCSFHDPAIGRSVARLAHPVLLTVAILPPNAPPSSTPADPAIIRRRMELLASDMITRALLIASRKNFSHAARILKETRRIIETVADGLRQHAQSHDGTRSKREMQNQLATDGLSAILNDVDMLLEGLEEHKETFERDHRNYSAQQVRKETFSRVVHD